MTSARPPSPLSVVICAFNGLGYTRLLLESLRRYSVFEHEIVVWSDGSTDGTAAWLAEQESITWRHSPENLGICTAMNEAARLATRPYLFFPNTDHVLAPGWDEALLRQLGPRRVVSLACIEPGIVPVAPIFHSVNLGARWEEFDWAGFELTGKKLTRSQAVPGVNYPFALARTLWDEVGAMDERFNPGPANDPDLFYRLTFAGAEMVRAEDCLAYHFSGKSSRLAGEASGERQEWREVTDRNEMRFVQKWGEKYRYVNGGLPDPGSEASRRWFWGENKLAGVVPARRFRVLFDARAVANQTDGIGTYVVGLLRALARRSGEIDLYVLTNDPRLLARKIGPLRGMKCRIVACRPGDRPAQDRELPLVLEQVRPDVFHGPSFALPGGLRCAGVVTVHDLAFDIHPEWYPPEFVQHLRMVVESATSEASRVIAVSRRTREDLARQFPGAVGKTVCILEAPSESVALRRTGDLAAVPRGDFHHGAAYLLAVGMKQRRKNAIGLIRAFSQLARAGGADGVGLLMTMATKCEDPLVAEEARSLPPELDVFLAGHLQDADLSRALAGAAALVYPSLYEGFGLPVLDAMQAGVPVVCSNGGAIVEVAGDAALVCPTGDDAALSAALGRILSEPELRRDLSRRGLIRALTFSWDLAAMQTIQVYRDAAATPGERLAANEAPVIAARPEVLSPPAPSTVTATVRRLRVAVDARMVIAPHTGTGKYTLEILRHLSSVATDAEFVLIGPGSLDELALGVPLRVVFHVQAGGETLLNPSWEQFTSVAALSGCDVLFSPTGILPATRSCPGVAVIHDLAFLDRPDDFAPRLREHLARWVGRSCRSAESIIAVSAFSKNRILDCFGIPSEKVRVVHHGGPEPAGGERSRKTGPPTVLCVSSFQPNKNQMVLLEAFARAGVQGQAILVLAGRQGPSLVALQARAGELGLERTLKFEVDADDRRLAQLFREASIFAFPSAYEGFGLPLVEALAAGVPVLASRIPATEEVLGGAGVLLPPLDISAWADSLHAILNDPSAVESLANRSRQRSHAFSWSRTAAETWAAIREAGGRP